MTDKAYPVSLGKLELVTIKLHDLDLVDKRSAWFELQGKRVTAIDIRKIGPIFRFEAVRSCRIGQVYAVPMFELGEGVVALLSSDGELGAWLKQIVASLRALKSSTGGKPNDGSKPGEETPPGN